MREYRATDIRNVAVVGHGASGKTTLVDALAFVSGSSKRHGTIKEGTTLTDHTPEETERGYSISLGCAYAEWMDTKINLIDTPGYLDFHGDAIAGVAAADGVISVVSAQGGVEVGTEKTFHEAVSRGDPVLFVVSMMDKEHADFDRVYQQVKERLTSKVVPVEIPIGSGATFRGVINLFTRKAYLYTAGSKASDYTEADIPADQKETFDKYYQELIEAISATDDTLLERYLEGAEIGRDEAINGMKEAMKRMDLFPLFAVSAEHVIGIQAMLTELVQLMPSAYEMEELHGFKGAEGDHTVEIHAVDTNPFAALVFKTHSEPHVGEVSFFRIFSGQVANGQDVFNATRDGVEKMGHLCVGQGKERIEVPVLHAGDIGCVAKLKNTHTNDTLSTKEHPVRLFQIDFPEPVVHFAVHAATRNDEEKLQQGLHRLHDEDPTFETHYNPETHETIIAGLGGASPRRVAGQVAPQVQRRGRADAPAHCLPRDAHGHGGRPGASQEAVRRPRTVWRLLDSHGAAPTWRWLSLRRQDRGRRHSVGLQAGDRSRDPGGVSTRHPGRLSAGGLRGRAVRRLVPLGRLERNVVQDGRDPRLQGRGTQVQADPARAARPRGDHDPRSLPGRRDG
jgi:elongation factor G